MEKTDRAKTKTYHQEIMKSKGKLIIPEIISRRCAQATRSAFCLKLMEKL